MKKSKLFGIVLGICIVGMIAGCSQGSNPETKISEASEIVSEEVVEIGSAESESEEEITTEIQASVTDDVKELKFSIPLPMGGMLQSVEFQEVEGISDDKKSEMDRAARAGTPSSGLVINNAKNFYYYSKLSSDIQNIYDAMLLLAQDPSSEDNVVVMMTADDPTSSEFLDKYATAYFALVYDHPELFWLYNESETSVALATPKSESGSLHTVYLFFSNPVKDFEKQQKAFNKAADDFLSDINLKGSEREVAKAIHDKLINMVTYDMDTLALSPEESRASLSHTAYGALVENNKGEKNHAVCDGYSLAYVYLLQQAGIDAVFIGGTAGYSKSETEGHAWSMVSLDGKWHEVDSTWDDMGTMDDSLEEAKGADGYEYLVEALADKEYREILQHYLWGVSTGEISSFSPSEDYLYYTKDGKYALCLLAPSVHVRDNKKTAGPMGEVVDLAPIAK